MFRLHVLNPVPAAVQEIRYFKDRSAMHGPLFFRFRVNEATIEQIIEQHGLKPTRSVPDVIGVLNDRAKSQVNWWQSSEHMAGLEKYSIWYDPRLGIGDWHTRCLFIDGHDAYFITTGFFKTDEYIVRK